MSKTIPLYKAKAIFSELIDRALNGEEILITRDKVPVIRFMPIISKPKGRVFGAYRGRSVVTEEFFEDFEESELRAWE